MAEALASILVFGLLLAWVKPWNRRSSPLNDPDVIPFDFRFNPTEEQLKVLELSGDADHFLVRDVERDLLEQRVAELEAENARLKASGGGDVGK